MLHAIYIFLLFIIWFNNQQINQWWEQLLVIVLNVTYHSQLIKIKNTDKLIGRITWVSRIVHSAQKCVVTLIQRCQTYVPMVCKAGDNLN